MMLRSINLRKKGLKKGKKKADKINNKWFMKTKYKAQISQIQPY